MSQVGTSDANGAVIGTDMADGIRRELGQHVLLTPARVSEVLGVPESTLAFWRGQVAEVGLPYLQIGKRISYLERDLIDFIEKSRRTNGKSAGKAA